MGRGTAFPSIIAGSTASIVAQAYQVTGVPVTVHPGIGYDIISNHPVFSGGAIGGEAAEWDFKLVRWSRSEGSFDGGVVPVRRLGDHGPAGLRENAPSCVNNLRLQSGRPDRAMAIPSTSSICRTAAVGTGLRANHPKRMPPTICGSVKAILEWAGLCITCNVTTRRSFATYKGDFRFNDGLIDGTKFLDRVKTLVVKVGTSVLSTDDDRPGYRSDRGVGRTDCTPSARRNQTHPGVEWSDWCGNGSARIKGTPKGLVSHLQAAAATGQAHPIHIYDKAFRPHGYHAAQLLLTANDFKSRTRLFECAKHITDPG